MTTHTSLQLRHKSHDLSALAASLAFPVARIWASDTERESINGKPLGGRHEESYVSLRIKSPSATISEAIELVRIAFAKVPNNMMSILDDPTLRKVLYCTRESGGEELKPAEMQILVDLGIELGLD